MISNFQLMRFFLAIVLLLISSHFFGYLFQRFKLPRVIGEICGGLVLGPTFLGFLFPQAYNWIFNAFESETEFISIIYWIGLVLLMFVSGFEIQRFFDKSDRKLISAIFIGSTVIPLFAGWAIPYFYDFSWLLGPKANMEALRIIIAIATAVTSIPVISKIFIDLNILNTKFAKIVLATATAHDVILYVALAVATGLVSTVNTSFSGIALTILITLTFFMVILFVAPRIFKFINRSRFNLLLKSSASGYALFICFLFAAIASILNVNVVFGALLAGIVVGIFSDDKFEKARTNIRDISLGFFVPIYFAVVGLQLDLIHHFNVSFFLFFLSFTSFFSILGTIIALKFVKKDWLSSFNFGVAMTTRGGPGIVLASVAFAAGIINENFFSVLILVAIATSLLAGYWFQFVLSRKWELLRD